MKRRFASLSFLLAAVAVLFTAPYATRRLTPTPRLVAASHEDDVKDLLRKALSGDDKPRMERPKLPPGEHWVPLLRFTNTGINDESVAELAKALDAANEAGAEAILLELTTTGGSVPAGEEMSRVIEQSRAPVHCVVDGGAYSMGFYVLQSCNLRLMTKRSRLLMHEPHIQAASGTQTAMRNEERYLHAMSENMLTHEAHRMKISKDEARRHVEHSQDWVMLYDEALGVGAVDGVVPSVAWLRKQLQHNLKWVPDKNT